MRLAIPISIVLIAAVIIGCAKEYSQEGGSNPPPPDQNGGTEPIVKSEWEFKESNTEYREPVDTAYLTNQQSGQSLSVTGVSNSGSEKLIISIADFTAAIKKGKTYSTSQQQVKFLYKNSDTIYSAIPYYGGEMYVTITEIDEKKVQGTFYGLAKKDGGSYEIKEGKFSSPLKAVAASEAKGYIMLWAKELCNGPIKVKLNNIAGEIKTYSLVTPDCGDEGRATYNLAPGTYNWVAYCGKDSLTGKAELKAGHCTKVLITFPFKPTPITTTDSLKTCRLNSIQYGGCLVFECGDGPLHSPNRSDASFKGTQADTLRFRIAPIPVPMAHAVKYDGDKVSVSFTPERIYEFKIDSKGRVIEYAGFIKPDDFMSKRRVYVTYEYDDNNNLIRRKYLNEQKQLQVEMNFIWSQGNITKIKKTYGNFPSTDLVLYEYYHDKTVRSMPFVHFEAIELLLFQPIVNFGNHTKNPPKKVTYISGSPNVHEFDRYLIDANNYVISFRQIDKYGQFSRFQFDYTCE